MSKGWDDRRPLDVAISQNSFQKVSSLFRYNEWLPDEGYAWATPPIPDEYTWALTVRWNFQANNSSSALDNFREIAVRELLKNNVRFV